MITAQMVSLTCGYKDGSACSGGGESSAWHGHEWMNVDMGAGTLAGLHWVGPDLDWHRRAGRVVWFYCGMWIAWMSCEPVSNAGANRNPHRRRCMDSPVVEGLTEDGSSERRPGQAPPLFGVALDL